MRPANDLPSASRHDAPGLVIACLLASDLLAVAGSFVLSFLVRRWIPLLSPLAHGFDLYLSAWPMLLVWPFFLWRERLYPGLWQTAGEELRRTATASTLAGLVIAAATFVAKTGPQYSRPIIVGSWLLTLFLLPALRLITRAALTRMGMAGPRTVILGASTTARVILDGLRRQRPPALSPVALFDDDPAKQGSEVMGLPVIGGLGQAPTWARARGIRTAVVAMPGVPREKLIPIIEWQSRHFPRIIVVPDLFGLSSLDTETLQLQGVLVLAIRKNLLFRHNRIIKRAIDLFLLALASPVILLLSGLIGLAIVLESGRPAFFTHTRIGKGGARFQAWKFRTMVPQAERVLAAYLEQHPELRAEWDAVQKLKNDPRLTAVGRVLRRLSLDELPQLWNVARGEMSLVGPRPIVEEEIPRYGDRYELYTQVLPGLTGLWQVSGRSDLSYADRVWLDTHYVRNWSIWMDLVILVRTVWVVISGKGAY